MSKHEQSLSLLEQLVKNFAALERTFKAQAKASVVKAAEAIEAAKHDGSDTLKSQQFQKYAASMISHGRWCEKQAEWHGRRSRELYLEQCRLTETPRPE